MSAVLAITLLAASDLAIVHRVAVRDASPALVEHLTKRLVRDIPGIEPSSEEDADLVIGYDEVTVGDGVSWKASLFRLDCQEGDCTKHIYVVHEFGYLNGTCRRGESPIHAFAAELKQAILAPGSCTLELPAYVSP
jgi:hypothetical protein